MDLKGNNISDSGAVYLADLLADNTTIITLDVRSIGLTSAGMVDLMKGMERNHTIQSLNLSTITSKGRMVLGEAGAEAVGTFLSLSTSLTKLYMSCVGFMPESMSLFAPGLSQNRSLITLDLSSNKLGAGDMEQLSLALVNIECLENLYLADNHIENAGMAYLLPTVVKLRSLQALDLRKNRLSMSGLTLVSEALARNMSLNALQLDENDFRNELSDTYETKLKHSTRGEYLHRVMSSCHILQKSISKKLIGRELILEKLELSNCRLDDTVAISLFSSLEGNSSIYTVNLHRNDISDKSAPFIASFMKESEVLEAINIGYNRIGNKGAALIATAASQCQIGQVSLAHNRVEDVGGLAVIEALSCSSILNFILAGNELAYKTSFRIEELNLRNLKRWELCEADRHEKRLTHLRRIANKLKEVNHQLSHSEVKHGSLEQDLVDAQKEKEDAIEREGGRTLSLLGTLNTVTEEQRSLSSADSRVTRSFKERDMEMKTKVTLLTGKIQAEQRLQNVGQRKIAHEQHALKKERDKEREELGPFEQELQEAEREREKTEEAIERSFQSLKHLVDTMERKTKKEETSGGEKKKKKKVKKKGGTSTRSTSLSLSPSAPPSTSLSPSLKKKKKKGKRDTTTGGVSQKGREKESERDVGGKGKRVKQQNGILYPRKGAEVPPEQKQPELKTDS